MAIDHIGTLPLHIQFCSPFISHLNPLISIPLSKNNEIQFYWIQVIGKYMILDIRK